MVSQTKSRWIRMINLCLAAAIVSGPVSGRFLRMRLH